MLEGLADQAIDEIRSRSHSISCAETFIDQNHGQRPSRSITRSSSIHLRVDIRKAIFKSGAAAPPIVADAQFRPERPPLP